MTKFEREYQPVMERGDRDSTNSGPSQVSPDLDFQYVTEVLRKFKWFILLFTMAVFASTAYYVSTLTPIYRSTSTLLVEPQKANVVSIEAIYDVDDQNSEYYQTQLEILKSRELAENTIQALSLWDHFELVGGKGVKAEKPSILSKLPISLREHWAFKKTLSSASVVKKKVVATVSKFYISAKVKLSQLVFGSTEPVETPVVEILNTHIEEENVAPGSSRAEELKALRSFSGRIIVEPIRKTKLIRVSYESADPELASKVANEIGVQYIESYLTSRDEVTSNASEWLSSRLTELKSTLAASERRLRSFKRENGLVDVDGRVGRLDEQELLLLTTELSNARSQLSSATDVYRELRQLRNSPNAFSDVGLIHSDRAIAQTKMELGLARREMDRLLNRYGPRHPRVVDVQSQIDALNVFLRQNLDRIVGSTGQELKLLQQRVATIEAKLAEGKKEIQEIGSKKFQLEVFEREVATNQKLYDTFFSRYTESKSASGLRESNARIVEAAVPSPGPVRPRKSLITGAAGAAALMFAVLLSFVMDVMDKSVKGSRDIEKRLGLRLLGILPLVKRTGIDKKFKKRPLNPIGNADKAGKFAEAVNAVRTSLCIDARNKHFKIILITSSIPGEGKTTSSVNLAYSFGQQEKVLLIDGDMRRPAVGEAIGLESDAPGLSDLINMSVHPKDCIRRGVMNGAIDVLPAGQLPDHPLELLTNPRFEEVLSSLSEHYHRIIIDSAPVNAVSDALVYSQYADAVVYVIKSHATPVDIIKRGLDRLESAGANILGALVTQANIDKISSYGGEIHYAGFYDAYGYTGDKKKKRTKLKRKTYQEYLDTDEQELSEFTDFKYLGEPDIRVVGENIRAKRSSSTNRTTTESVG